MDVDAQSGVPDDLLATLAAWVGSVLALPVKVAAIDPVVHVLMLYGLAFLLIVTSRMCTFLAASTT